MKMKQKCLFFLCVVLVLQIVFTPQVQAEGYSDYLDKIIDMAKDRYYRDIPDEKLLEGALRGIFDTMDDYTMFFDIDEANSFLDSMEGNYQGIGVEIMQVPEGVVITKVFRNSPAEAAGLFADDRIVQVDGEDIKGFSPTDASGLIRGEAGTYVELGVLRGNSTDIIPFRVQRNTVNISPVSWKVDGDIMYIQLESFSSNSNHFFEQALKEMDKMGIQKMILDLRNNPGGEVFQAVSIARHLVRSGLITKLDFKSEQTKDIEYLSYQAKPKYIPAVLVNGNSASASEILASALQDSEDGFLIGSRTFGKGVVQNIYPILTPAAYEKYKLEYGDSFIDGYDWVRKYNVNILESDLIGWSKITTGHYLTRSGQMIDGVGITPNFTVEDYTPVNGLNIHEINPLESTDNIGLNGVGNDVYNAEKILVLKGYELEKADNILDEKTSDLIRQYQELYGLDATGTINHATRDAFNKDLEQLRLTIDRPYAKAVELLGLLK